MYEWINKNIQKYKQGNHKLFNNLRLNIMKFDELNVFTIRKEVEKTFKKLREKDIQFFYMLIDYLATEYKDGSVKLDEFLESYNGTLLYVYSNEVERKQQRYTESMISLSKKEKIKQKQEQKNQSEVRKKNESQMLGMPSVKIVSKSMVYNENVLNTLEAIRNQKANENNWNKQLEEVSVDLEREYIISDMKNRGVKRIMWITQRDNYVCEECDKLDGLTFSPDNLPARPHINCRCAFKEVVE